MGKRARAGKRAPVCRCDCDYEISTIQEDAAGMHRIVLICEDCERAYRVGDAFGDNLSETMVAHLLIKATEPR